MAKFTKLYDAANDLEQRSLFRRAISAWREALRCAVADSESNLAMSGLRRCSSSAKYSGRPEPL